MVREPAAGISAANRFGKFGRYIDTSSGGADYLKEVSVGQRVNHKKFGTGSVVKVSGEGDDTVVEIVFDRAGMKRLMLTYAKLTAAE